MAGVAAPAPLAPAAVQHLQLSDRWHRRELPRPRVELPRPELVGVLLAGSCRWGALRPTCQNSLTFEYVQVFLKFKAAGCKFHESIANDKVFAGLCENHGNSNEIHLIQ